MQEEESNRSCCSSSASTNDLNPCPICLGPVTQEAYLDQCFHKYCFNCITRWAKVVAVRQSQPHSSLQCPFCKRDNFSIVYGCNGDSFQRYYINQDPESSNFFSESHKYRLQTYYHESGAICDKFDIHRYWKLRRYLLPNKWFQIWLRREIQALIQVSEMRVWQLGSVCHMCWNLNGFLPELLVETRDKDNALWSEELEEEVDIIVHHILGVVESFVTKNEHAHSKRAPEEIRNEFKALISNAAKPFLIGRTERFMNEVELFLASGLTVEAYDKVYLQSQGMGTSSTTGEGEEEKIHKHTTQASYLHFFDEDSDTE